MFSDTKKFSIDMVTKRIFLLRQVFFLIFGTKIFVLNKNFLFLEEELLFLQEELVSLEQEHFLSKNIFARKNSGGKEKKFWEIKKISLEYHSSGVCSH